MLEQLARLAFNRYSLKEAGKILNWKYLSHDRKKEWMKDSLLISRHYCDILKKKIKPVGNKEGGETSWGQGYTQGLKFERTNLLIMLQDIHEDLEEEFEEFNTKGK